MITTLSGYSEDSPRNIPLDMKRHYLLFIMETLKYKVIPWKRVSRNEIAHVKNMLLQYFASTAQSDAVFLLERKRINETWATVERYMLACPGLVRFMLEIGAHSRFFYPFLLDIPKGMAMLPAFGKGRDIFGKIQPIPPTDAMYQYCLNDLVFRSARFRNDYEKRDLKDAYIPFILAGGTLPQFWHGEDCCSTSKFQSITVYDPDRSLMDALTQIFGDLVSNNIDFRFEGFDVALRDERNFHRYDFASAMGLASYFIKDLGWILGRTARCVMPGKPIIFDLQLLVCPLIFDKLVLHWETESPMKPSRNATRAVNYVYRTCKDVGIKLEDYEVAPGGAGIVFKAIS